MLKINHISKDFINEKKEVNAIDDLHLEIHKNEFIVLVGPSGCGKSTLLKIIAGIVKPTNGKISLNGIRISKPNKDIGMVFQNFTLFPWLTVRQNISFGLNVQKLSKEKKEATVNHYLTLTELEEFADSFPENLSGGMKQRVAIARTLATNPKIILMDEPFGSLDAQTRKKMQTFLLDLWNKEKKTVVFVTHDVKEALLLADKIHVLSNRPSNIKKTFVVPFSRPRKHDLQYSEKFFELEKSISKELE